MEDLKAEVNLLNRTGLRVARLFAAHSLSLLCLAKQQLPFSETGIAPKPDQTCSTIRVLNTCITTPAASIQLISARRHDPRTRN